MDFGAELGARIQEAREHRGYTQAQLSAAVGLDRSALAKIETGRRRVSAVELSRVATELDVQVAWFVDDQLPAIVSRRNAQEPGAPSPTIDRCTERVAQDVEFLIAQGDLLSDWTPLEPFAPPETKAAVEEMARDVRVSLALRPEEPLRNLGDVVSKVGLLAFSFDLGVDAADGASITLRRGGVAIVNGDRAVGRRRLTLAHELGHYLLADEYTIDWQLHASDRSDRKEQQIDHFARALLLPPSSLTEGWPRLAAVDGLRGAAVVLASQFRVDMSTLARRLEELGLIGSVEANDVRKVRTTKADIVAKDLLLSDELAPPSLPRDYMRAVLGLYEQETITAARAISLLDGWVESDLPALPTLPHDAIWSVV